MGAVTTCYRLWKCNGHEVCRTTMAEPLVTLAFLGSLAHIGMLFRNQFMRTSAGVIAALLLIQIIQIPTEAWVDLGGFALIMTMLLNLTLVAEMPTRKFRAMIALTSAVSLLTMFPANGYPDNWIGTNEIGKIWLSPFGICIIAMLTYSLMEIGERVLARPVGKYRAYSLGVSTLFGIVAISVLSLMFNQFESRLGDGSGLVEATLWMVVGIVGIGLIGMLLPLAGIDADPRPEAWGWRRGILLSLPLLTLWTDLASNAIPGILLAILLSLTAPLVVEKSFQKGA